MADNMLASVSGIVIRDNKVLLVRHSYGLAKGLLAIPGGFLSKGEMPNVALEREILEETGIVALTKNLLAMRFSNKDWWAILEPAWHLAFVDFLRVFSLDKKNLTTQSQSFC